MKAALHNLGCKTNSYEAEAMEQALKDAGYEIVDFAGGEPADVYVINTCSVTNIADRKSRQMLHKARVLNRSAVIAAVGCFVQTNLKDIERLADSEGIDICIGSNDKIKLVDSIGEFLSHREKIIRVSDLRDKGKKAEYEPLTMAQAPSHTRAFIKIEDGCDQFCTFCIIPYARGGVRSRRPTDILNEARSLANKGVKEIVLTGINMSAYGKDLTDVPDGIDLADLILMLQELEGIVRLRVSSVEPRLITKEFLEKIKAANKLCPHFHLSLQSGSAGVLKRMNRHYTPQEYLEKCELLRRYYDTPSLTTDIIAGFPGETDVEFCETLEFVKKVDFFDIHVFQYSPRKGTPAAVMPGSVDGRVKRVRSAVLIRSAQEMREKFLERLEGKEAEVLIEEKYAFKGIEYYTGHTARYEKVYLKCDPPGLEGEIVRCRVAKLLDDGVSASLMS